MTNARSLTELGTERGRPPYFAGRTEELDALGKRLNRLCATGDPTDGLTLIVGVPGAGKTRLGTKFVEQAAERRDAMHVNSLVIDTRMLSNDVDLFLAMGDVLGRGDEFRRTADLDSRTTGRGGALGPVRGNVTQEHVRHTSGLSALLRNTKSSGAWDGQVLIVVVDELQTADDAGIDSLRMLHEGAHGCRILSVGIGLQHTPQVLANPKRTAGISRVGQTIALEPLKDHEAVDAIDKGMQAMGHEIPELAVQALAAASLGFPQHVHGYLAGALAAIAKHGSLDGPHALKDALALGDEARSVYYDTRLSMLDDQDAVLPLIELMIGQNRRSLRKREAVEAVSAANLDGTDIVNHAIAHGVLTVSLQGDVSFGIPSFHAHMANRLAVDRQRQLRFRRATKDSASNPDLQFAVRPVPASTPPLHADFQRTKASHTPAIANALPA